MLDPNTTILNDRRFYTDGEYLESLFVLLDLMLFADPSPRMQARGLGSGQSSASWAELIRDRLEMSFAADRPPAAEVLLEMLKAPYYMRFVLAYLIRITLDPSYETAAASEQGKKMLNLYDLCAMDASAEEREDPAVIYGLLESGRSCLTLLFPQLAARECRTGQSMAGLLPDMDARLLAILMGKGEETPLPQGMERYVPGDDSEDSKTEDRNVQAARILLRRKQAMPPEVCVLWGAEGSGKRETAQAFAALAQQPLLFYELRKPETAGPGAEDELPPGFRTPDRMPARLRTELALFTRECVLYHLQPVLCHAERLPMEMQKDLVRFLQQEAVPLAGSIFLMIETEEMPDYLPECFFLGMEEIRVTERIRLWREAFSGNTGIGQEGLDAVARTFRLTPGQIRSAAAQALRLAGPDGAVTEDLLYEVCYAQLGHPLGSHTQRVRSPFTWDDLKMSAPDKAVLRDLVNSVRNRHIVMQEWNFEHKLPYGTGVTALFAGPPGTGKTMAAQVIANALHMELYKIDLSQLIDKYVGETEKNIKRVFTEAGRSNSVLFFDEADAIFNKRLEAGNSNDRFANIESSLLLQCVEEYSGVTLLATNNQTAIDAAFIRRFRFYLLFKEPDEDIRYEIWSSVFPKEAPVDPEVDFRELANQFQFTGAIIKNVALQAAYLAAASGKSIGAMEIMIAIRREMEKNHRMLNRDSMGKYEHLFPEVIAWNGGE